MLDGGRRVVIIGAGLAGLGAAYTLVKAGLAHTVFESDDHPGGRVKTEQVEGFYIDTGANVFLETWGTVRQVAEELGVSFKRTRVPINGGLYHNGRLHGVYGGNRLFNRLRTAAMLLSFRLLSPRGCWQLLRFVRMLRARGSDLSFDDHSRMLDLDTGESTSEFFESKVGAEILEKFIQPNLTGYTFGYPEEVGIPFAMVASWNFGLNGVAWPNMPERGPGEFADALVRACEDGIRLSTPVERIVIEDGAATGVVTAAGELVEADAVICATTATAALKITSELPSDIRETLGSVTYSKCCRVVFGSELNPFPKDWYAVAFPRGTGTFIAGMSNSAVLLPESVPEGKSLIDVFVVGKEAEELFLLDDREIEKRVIAVVRKYFPHMSEEPLFTRTYRWDEAVCLLPGGAMAALHKMNQKVQSSVKGLYFCGEYTGVPSTNGALRSGIRAAEDCARFLRSERGSTPI